MREKPIVVKWFWWPFGGGITLYPFIFVFYRERAESIFKHECMHWYQIEEMGVIKFYKEIIKEYWRYRAIEGPLEQECEDYELEPLTFKEQEWWYEKA